MLHAFYIGIFGIRYKTRDGDHVLWPNQFVWLLEKGLLDWQDHAPWGLWADAIQGKSDADATAKLFALAQVAWFVAQSILRLASDLSIMRLESMTLSYIPIFALTYFFWWMKPRDIETPTISDLPPMTAL